MLAVVNQPCYTNGAIAFLGALKIVANICRDGSGGLLNRSPLWTKASDLTSRLFGPQRERNIFLAFRNLLSYPHIW